mgnify:CR=1 FL=1
MNKQGRTFAFFFVLGILFTSAFADDLTPRGTIRGTVSDQNRAVITGARIEVVRNGRGTGLTTTSNSQGEFYVSIDAGEYELRVQGNGFSSITKHIAIAPGESSVMDIELGLAENSASVTVISSGEYMTDTTFGGTKTLTVLGDVPQSISVVGRQQLNDQMLTNIGDVVRYQPGISAHQGENNRDQVIIRGQSSSADFFINAVRGDVRRESRAAAAR